MATPDGARRADLGQRLRDIEQRQRRVARTVSTTGPAGPTGPSGAPALYTHYLANVVVNTTAKTSAIGTGKGVGSMTLNPGLLLTVATRLDTALKGTYQTPLSPGQVTVDITLGGIVIARAVVTASVLATMSTVNSLLGQVVIVVTSVSGNTARVRCDGEMTFQTTATGAAFAFFSTAAAVASGAATATAGTSGATATVDVPANTALLLDVVETWSNAQAGQGTTITNGQLRKAA